MRLGKVIMAHGYVVDLDNEEMVEQAKLCLFEDMLNAYKYDEIADWIGTKEANRFHPTYSEDDIPDFLIEADLERQARAWKEKRENEDA